MPKLRKLRTSKKFRYGVNRKRMNRKEKSSGTIKCPDLKKVWENRKTISNNLRDIGLVSDPNKVIKLSNTKEKRLNMKKHGFVEEDNEPSNEHRSKSFLQNLEENANAFREPNLKLPKGRVQFLTNMMDKYGLNYKKMVYDLNNHDQWTWKQFRAAIRRFMKIPIQFESYLQTRNSKQDFYDLVEYCSEDEL